MTGEAGFEIHDDGGTLFTLTADEAPRFLRIMDEAHENEPLSESLMALRSQLAEWVNPQEAANFAEVVASGSQSERTVPLVRGLRAQLGLTQAQLAARANVCRATVRDAERGARQPQRTTAIALADALGFPPASVFPDLFGQEDRCVRRG